MPPDIKPWGPSISHGIPAKNAQPESNHDETWDKTKLRDILQITSLFSQKLCQGCKSQHDDWMVSRLKKTVDTRQLNTVFFFLAVEDVIETTCNIWIRPIDYIIAIYEC